MAKSIYNEEYRKLVKSLKDARLKAGLTQQQVADAMGKPQSFVAKIEGYERRLDIVEFLAITRAIKNDPVQVLKKSLKS